MSIQLQFRRGNTAQTAVFTGAVAELTVDTDKNTVILHDGVTAGGYALARESALSANQAIAQNAFNKANAAYDAANTKYSSSGGTILGNVVVTGNVSPTTDNVYSLGSASYRWKDIFVGAGTVDIDGVKLSKVSNQLVISGATDLVLSGTNLPSSTNTANNIANAFNQANLAYDAANTAFTAGGARAFDQANLAFDKANSAWDYANSAYGTANNEILTRQANVGAAVITLTGNYEANVGAGLISNKLASDVNVGSAIAQGQANVGAGLISTKTAYEGNVGSAIAQGQANVGAGLITVASSYEANVGSAIAQGQANVGAGLISTKTAYEGNVGAGLISINNSITSAYQANVGQLRLDAANANTSLAANIGAARIADQASSQANVGAGLITVTNTYQANVGAGLISLNTSLTNAYQANVGAAKIIALGRADSAFAQANLAFDAANNVAPQIQPTRDVANSAFAQANLAYAAANSKLSSSGGTVSGDLAVTGNLTISGNTTTLNVSSLKVTDSIIQLGVDNQSDLVDIGFLGHYANTPNNHTGLVRKYTDGVYYLFDSWKPGTEPTNIVDIANTRVATLSANIITNVIAIRGLDPLNYANTIQTSAQANVGAGLITVTNNYQANVGAARIADVASGQANVGAGLISVTNAYQVNVGQLRLDTSNANTSLAANIGAARIADAASSQANTGAGLISLNTSITNAYQANVGAARIADSASAQANSGAGLIANKLASDANVGAGLISLNTSITSAYQANVGAARIADVASGQANVGAGLISATSTITSAYQANVGAGLITVTNGYQANTGAGLITKVAKAGDTMTGSLSTSGSLIGLNLTANNILTVNTNSIYEATAVTTSTTAQVVLDSFPTATYRSAKYLVQITSGSSYELLELTLIHDGTTVYLSQYGNIKTGATLGVFDATISAGTLSVLATPNNAITTFKTAATLIPT